MIFKRAEYSQLGEILELYRVVSKPPFSTWNAEYPSEREAAADYAAGTLYVLEEGMTLVGCISLVPERELDDLPCWDCSLNVGEIARVAVAPAYQGRGLALRLVEEAEKLLCNAGCTSVHLLVACGNLPAGRTYQKAGYRIRGEVEMYGNRYYACEKQIAKSGERHAFGAGEVAGNLPAAAE